MYGNLLLCHKCNTLCLNTNNLIVGPIILCSYRSNTRHNVLTIFLTLQFIFCNIYHVLAALPQNPTNTATLFSVWLIHLCTCHEKGNPQGYKASAVFDVEASVDIGGTIAMLPQFCGSPSFPLLFPTLIELPLLLIFTIHCTNCL